MMHCLRGDSSWAICFILLMLAIISTTSQQSFPLTMTIPWSDSVKSNEYLCTTVPVPHNATYIVRYDPSMNTGVVHHMLLYGCAAPYTRDNVWDCKGMGRLCDKTDSPHILFGWGRNAGGIQLPQGVGFKIRGSTGIDWLVLQLHYGDLPDNKHQFAGSINGLTVQLTSDTKESLAGVFLLAAYAFKEIPPTTNVVNFDLACQYYDNVIVPFAYRVHAHSLGVRISGYVVKNNGTDWVELGSRSPQDPQAFYPVTNNVTVNPGDYLAARCTYSSVEMTSVTNIGADTNDEMCNFYIMYSTDNNPSAVSYGECAHPAPRNLEFPEEDDYQCPEVVPPIARQQKEDTLFVDQQWTLSNVIGSEALSLLGVALGQVTAVQARAGHVYVLHRGVIQWDSQSFNQSNYYMNIAAGPIQQSTVLELNSTGHLISQWGENMLYMPHGLTIDSHGNYWITDVAMHQVFKFTPERKKALELGVAFSPGNDQSHFCKPASVAVDAVTGVVFVADGYCNSRVVLFSPTGEYLMEQSATPSNLGMNVVHKLVIVEKLDQLLVADRENGRLLAYRLHNMELLWSMRLPDLGRTIYSVDVNSSGVLQMFAVAKSAGYGITVDQSGAVLDRWSPPHIKFLNPHDVAMDTDGSAVYVTEIGPNRIWRFVRRAAANETNNTRLSSTATTLPSAVHITTSSTNSQRYFSTLLVSSSLSINVTTSSTTKSHQYSTPLVSSNADRSPLLYSSSSQSPSILPTSSTEKMSFTKQTFSLDSQSHITTVASLTASSHSYPSIQTSSYSVSVVSTSKSTLSKQPSFRKQTSFMDNQSHITITSTVTSLTAWSSSQSDPNIQTSLVSTSVTTLSEQTSFTKQASSVDSQSHITITSTISFSTASSKLHPNIQISSVSVVSTSVTTLSKQSSFTKQTSSADGQSHITITSLTASSQLHSNVQKSSVSVVSTSVTTLSVTTVNSRASSVSSVTSTDSYRSVTALQVVALVLSGLVLLVVLMIVVLTVRYCNYGNSLQPQNLRKKLFPMNSHHGFTQLQTFDPDGSDDELTVFTKF